MPARIFAPAESRLLDIWDYTLERWGQEQADLYLRDLIKHIHSLSQERPHWRHLADPDLPGIWFIRHRHHYIFFRELSPGLIGVITVLHEKMNLPARIRQDADQAGESTDSNRS